MVQLILGSSFILNISQIKWGLFSALRMVLLLLMLASMSISTVTALWIRYQKSNDKESPFTDNHIQRIKMNIKSSFSKLVFATASVSTVLFITGILVSNSQSPLSCSSWPLCYGLTIPTNLSEWFHFIHRLSVFLTSIMLIVLTIKAWKTQRSQTVILSTTTAAAVLFFAQALMGSALVNDAQNYLIILHQATAVAVWIVLVTLVIFVGIDGQNIREGSQENADWFARSGLIKDLFSLTKPIVVILLLVTTFAGMVIGGQAWPPFMLTFWTLIAGFLAAGGSGAINQYIDRFDDNKMQRTQKRPIPSGRLTPAEGLAFGIAMVITSFYIMVAFVGILAALLTLAGIIYYVLIYSIILKKSTIQNIVIGGGAGAIPPLVGWAAVTGSLNIPSLFLFAVVFMWTPPHFWALAIVRRKDYARAGVPMLPVIRGEEETRKQILIYTLELVILTLLLPVFGLGGGIYFIGAAMLGSWLLVAAWKVWRKGGNKLAWKMYRYSSMYLAFLFLVLMVDRLV
jgi:protoheme IX farnesyltransferase